MIFLIRNAHWPMISYTLSQDNRLRKRVCCLFQKKNGYGIELKNDFIALASNGKTLYLVFNNLFIEVLDSEWSAKVDHYPYRKRRFQLFKSNEVFLKLDYVDSDKSRSITPEPHFLDDVSDWLKDDKSKKCFLELIG